MSKKNYNVFFNTHTVSGIIVSFVLYVIFFAGAFALFKDEIAVWEKGDVISHTERENIDYDNILEKFDNLYELTGRDVRFTMGKEEDQITVYMLPSKDSLASEAGKKSEYFFTNINSVETETYTENYNLGEFLFRLHFFS